MQNKTLVGIIVILLILIGVVASQDNFQIAGNDKDSEESLVSDQPSVLLPSAEPGMVASAETSNLIGVWRSSEDRKYILELAADNIAREYYAQRLVNVGRWASSDDGLQISFFSQNAKHSIDLLTQDSLTLISPAGQQVSFSAVAL